MQRKTELQKPKLQKANIYEERTFEGVEDMVMLSDISDDGIVDNLNKRLVGSEIYTYIGSVLVICNPYKWLKIYDNDTIQKYPFRQQTDASPHIFYTAEAAYRGLVVEEESQCIIVSGESGAGKTETSKQIQTYIAAVCGGGQGVEKLKEVFLSSNPVLEAFGNAKTLRNNNSSRFGKYFELKFNRMGQPKGGLITNYLLEKSRIVKPSLGERGFHIFYQLLSSNFKDSLKLDTPRNYNYLSCSECFTVEGIDDKAEFDHTVKALRSVGFTESDIQTIMAIVAGILHLGNVTFVPAEGKGSEDGSAVTPGNTDINYFAKLLKLDPEKVAYVLTTRELQTINSGQLDISFSSQNPVQAADRRDALARSLYERLFNMIVERINRELDPQQVAKVGESDFLSIGVLDIYGFEIFDKNGFEQLCINYVNEKLQQIFIELTLRAEQDEYTREGIQWTPIPFFNNRIVCELLDANTPAGLFRILDDVSRTKHTAQDPYEIDKGFLKDADKMHSNHEHFIYKIKNDVFTIKHYAGDVAYTVGKFGETNKDALKADLVKLVKASGLSMISETLYGTDEANDLKLISTVFAGTRIRTQTQALVDALMDCEPHYVRCVKSNDDKRPLYINKSRVLHQVKYLGLGENIRVRRAGFAYRCDHHKFLDRFYLLSAKTYPDWKGSDADGCKAIIDSVKSKIPSLAKPGEVQYGHSMIFIRNPEALFSLNVQRKERLNDIPVPIQRAWRRYKNKREVDKLPEIMAELYKKNHKGRNRTSIFRDYNCEGYYLTNLGQERANRIMDGVYRIVDYYDKNETIKFIDHEGHQIINTVQQPNWLFAPRVFVLTDVAIYIMKLLTPVEKAKITKKPLPDVVLCRRIVLKEKKISDLGVLESWNMTTLADGLVALNLRPVNYIHEPKKQEREGWIKKDAVKSCQITGQPFSFFDSKKRCKVSGKVAKKAVCDIMAPIPDHGFYKPDRVCDEMFGRMSTDQVEDVLIHSSKKTEFLGILLNEWEKLYGNRSLPRFSSANKFSLRRGPSPETSAVPATEIIVTVDPSIMDDNSVKCELSDLQEGVERVLSIKVSDGIPDSVVKARLQRRLDKLARAEANRKKNEAERKIRVQQRAAAAEKNRIARQQEKAAQALQRRNEAKTALNVKSSSPTGKGGAAELTKNKYVPMATNHAFAPVQKTIIGKTSSDKEKK